MNPICQSDPEEAMRIMVRLALTSIAEIAKLPHENRDRGLRSIADAALEALGEDRKEINP